MSRNVVRPGILSKQPGHCPGSRMFADSLMLQYDLYFLTFECFKLRKSPILEFAEILKYSQGRSLRFLVGAFCKKRRP